MPNENVVCLQFIISFFMIETEISARLSCFLLNYGLNTTSNLLYEVLDRGLRDPVGLPCQSVCTVFILGKGMVCESKLQSSESKQWLDVGDD